MQCTHELNLTQDLEPLFHPCTPLDKVRGTGRPGESEAQFAHPVQGAGGVRVPAA